LDGAGIIQEVSVAETCADSPGFQSLRGRLWLDTVAPDSRAKVEGLLRDLRESGRSRSREINQRVEGIGDVPLRVSLVPLGDAQQVAVLGQDLRLLSGLQQQLVAAQQTLDREYGRLRQAETRYRLLFQVTSEGVLIADAASLKVIESNGAVAQLLSESTQSLQGQAICDLFTAASWETVQTLIVAVQAGGRAEEVHAVLRHGKQDVRVAASLFRQSGAMLILLRLRPAQTLTARADSGRHARMLDVLNALPDGVVIIDAHRQILSANPAFCEMVQVAHEGLLLGQPIERFVGRPGVDINLILANLREHGSVRNFATVIGSDLGTTQEAIVSAVATGSAREPCIGLSVRVVPVRTPALGAFGLTKLRSVEQLRELVGRVSLKDIVRESVDLIERLCIEAALQVSGDNRASAAQLLGLSRQGFYLKLHRHGLGDLQPEDSSGP
jgi:transcriptional regulator PpsR